MLTLRGGPPASSVVPRFLFFAGRGSLSPLALLLASCLLKPAVASDLDHRTWDELLTRYVSAEGRVDYAGVKQNSLAQLDAYLDALAAPWPDGMAANATKAALINAYNALTVRWILNHYPVASIQATRDPFTAARHRLDGEMISLDQAEQWLRQTGDPRIHAALVCAARSCPPLRGEAYEAARLEEQLDDNTRKWLANTALNEFHAAEKRARVSPIFRWYEADFGGEERLRAFLLRYGPPDQARFLAEAAARIEYQDYDWGLNQAGGATPVYPRWRLFADVVRNHRFFPAGVILASLLAGGTAWRRLRRRGADRSARRSAL